MTISQRIFELLSKNNKKQKDLADYIGLSTSAVSDWKKKGTNPAAESISVIADFFNVSSDYILTGKETILSTLNLKDDELELLKDFNKLSEKSKGKVMGTAKILAEFESPKVLEPVITYIDLYDMPVSAGTGVDLSGYDKEKLKVKQSEEVEQADFCLRISGNSMEPDFHHGDIILIKGKPTIQIGEIGIFIVNGSGYIKELGRNKLISLNDDYDDIILTENDSVWCMGEVIGTLEKDDFLD